MLIFSKVYVNGFIIFMTKRFSNVFANNLNNDLVKSYDITVVDNGVVERRVQMAINRTARTPDPTAPTRGRGPLKTLMSILGDVAQVTGIGIRYF